MASFFDSHAHYNDSRFDPDRDELIPSLPGRGIARVMNVGADLESSRSSIALAEQYPFIYASVGVHPHSADELDDGALSELERLSRHPRVLAIGEIGLDYHYDFSPRPAQLAAFERQLELARQLDLPVIVHSREAHQPTLDILRRFRPRGVVHCFSGSAELARQLVDLGLYLGFTGVVTFKNARKSLEAAAAVPPDRLLIETDCPYMAPEPFRGRRCDSSLLPFTAEQLAAAQGVSVEELARRTFENACTLYGLPL